MMAFGDQDKIILIHGKISNLSDSINLRRMKVASYFIKS